MRALIAASKLTVAILLAVSLQGCLYLFLGQANGVSESGLTAHGGATQLVFGVRNLSNAPHSLEFVRYDFDSQSLGRCDRVDRATAVVAPDPSGATRYFVFNVPSGVYVRVREAAMFGGPGLSGVQVVEGKKAFLGVFVFPANGFQTTEINLDTVKSALGPSAAALEQAQPWSAPLVAEPYLCTP